MPYSPQNLGPIMGEGYDAETDSLKHLGTVDTHETQTFPEATDLTVTIAGHAMAHTWSAWAEIADSGATTFSSRISNHTHISAIGIEETSAAGNLWMIEISYGDSYIVVARVRFETLKVGQLETTPIMRIRSAHIPEGQTVYARCMCSAAGEDCQIHLRYYSG